MYSYWWVDVALTMVSRVSVYLSPYPGVCKMEDHRELPVLPSLLSPLSRVASSGVGELRLWLVASPQRESGWGRPKRARRHRQGLAWRCPACNGLHVPCPSRLPDSNPVFFDPTLSIRPWPSTHLYCVSSLVYSSIVPLSRWLGPLPSNRVRNPPRQLTVSALSLWRRSTVVRGPTSCMLLRIYLP